MSRTTVVGLTIFTRSLERSVAFYSLGLGLKVKFQGKKIAELEDGKGLSVTLQTPASEAFCSSGYSPVIELSVDNFQAVRDSLLMYGASEDGKTIEDEEVKMGMFRSLDGVMLSVTQYKKHQHMQLLETKPASQEGLVEVEEILKRLRI